MYSTYNLPEEASGLVFGFSTKPGEPHISLYSESCL